MSGFPAKFRKKLALPTTLVFLFASCDAGMDPLTPTPEEIPEEFKGIPELAQPLEEIPAERCQVQATSLSNVTLTITLDADEVVLVSSDQISSRILVNLQPCAGTYNGATVYPTRTTLRTLIITGDDTGNEIVVLDYLHGLFGRGTSVSTYGTFIDLKGGDNDSVKIRMTSSVDRPICGNNAGNNVCKLNTNSFPDLKELAGVDSMLWTLGAGADIFSGAGDSHTGNAPTTIDLTVYGGSGNDTLRGGDGDDTLFGGDGNDTLHAEANKNSSDTFYGGEPEFDSDGMPIFFDEEDNLIPSGTDTVTYAARATAVIVSMGDDINEAGDDFVEANDGEQGEGDRVMYDVENLIGGSGHDDLTGSDRDNVISGGDGNDILRGGDGNDTLNGNAGNDFFDEGTAANGSDVFNGGSGTDIVDYGRRTNPLTVTMLSGANDGEEGEGDEFKLDMEGVFGGSAADNITGNPASNIISGGGGDDILHGGTTGTDVFLVGYKDAGNDDIDGGSGTSNTVDYSSDHLALLNTLMPDDDKYEARDAGVIVEMVSETMKNIRRLIGTDHADTITGTTLADHIEGRGGADIIDAAEGNDTIHGGEGDDDVECGPGDDTVYGGPGENIFSNCETIL